jgi:NADPH:quinone reductase-like Zn-dependent oxidoreductase
MARRWVLTGSAGFESSLEFQKNVPVPSADELGSKDVLVTMHATSLNYRDLKIPEPDVSL